MSSKEPGLIRALLIEPGGEGDEILLVRKRWLAEVAKLLNADDVRPMAISEHVSMLFDEDAPYKSLSFNKGATDLATLIAGRQVVNLEGTIVFVGAFKNGFPTNYDFSGDE